MHWPASSERAADACGQAGCQAHEGGRGDPRPPEARGRDGCRPSGSQAARGGGAARGGSRCGECDRSRLVVRNRKRRLRPVARLAARSGRERDRGTGARPRRGGSQGRGGKGNAAPSRPRPRGPTPPAIRPGPRPGPWRGAATRHGSPWSGTDWRHGGGGHEDRRALPFPIPLPTGQEQPSPTGGDRLGGRCGFGREEPATFGLDKPAALGLLGRPATLPREEGLTPRCPEPAHGKGQRPEDAPWPVAAEAPVPLPVPPSSPQPVNTPVPLAVGPVLTLAAEQSPHPVETPEPHVPEPAPLPEQPPLATEEPADPPLPAAPPQRRQEGPESRDAPPRQEQPRVAEADLPAPHNPHRPTTPAGPDEKPLVAAPEAGPTKPARPDKPLQPNVAAPPATADLGTRIFNCAPAVPLELREQFADSREPSPAERSAAENAFRFDELGVFGLHGRAAAVEAPQIPQPPLQLPAARPATAPLPQVAAPPAASLPTPPLQRLPAEPPLPRPGRPGLDLGIKLEPRAPRPRPSEGEASQAIAGSPGQRRSGWPAMGDAGNGQRRGGDTARARAACSVDHESARRRGC